MKHLYPRIIVPERKNVVEVNTKEMLIMHEYNYLFENIPFNKIECSKKESLNKNFIGISFDSIIKRYSIKCIVDDSYTIPIKGYQYKFIPLPKTIKIYKRAIYDSTFSKNKHKRNFAVKEFSKYLHENIQLEKEYVKCFPLYILNKTNDTILTRIKFIQEAKDKNGNWNPIEHYKPYGGCMVENNYCKLGSNNYIIYPIIKYFGNYKTKLRVKIYNQKNIYYSNEFEGCINYSQFDTIHLKNYGF